MRLCYRLGELKNMYSHFRPYRRDLDAEERRVLRPPGDIPGTRTYAGSMAEQYHGEAVKQLLSLEDYERFTQLCAVTNLVKLGPRNGLFTRFVEVEDSVVRVFRSWLKRLSDRSDTDIAEDIIIGGSQNGGNDTARAENLARSNDLSDEAILWMNPAKTTGLRLRVRERKLRRDAPILIVADEEEDTPVTFEIEYQGGFLLHKFVEL
jgi:hypothetical protein